MLPPLNSNNEAGIIEVSHGRGDFKNYQREYSLRVLYSRELARVVGD
jgi:hypothetical protein